jgi:hypothetical protein
MKLMFWNIQKLGDTKLSQRLPQAITGVNQMGNNKLDYIVKVATGANVWQNATTAVPVDVFVIVELVSGGKGKGGAGTGACTRALPRIRAAMNLAVNQQNYLYASVAPLIVGFHEVVGVIYNTRTLTNPQSSVSRNTQNQFLNPRSPFRVQFDQVNAVPKLNIFGIHGPTSQPTSENYKDAIVYTNAMSSIAAISQTNVVPRVPTFIGGDFNVDPKNTYGSGNGSKKTKVPAFQTLDNANYKITLPNGTLTSLRNRIDNNQVPPKNYLSQPYDNIVFTLPAGQLAPNVLAADLIGQAPTYAGHEVATFNGARGVSDHLPLTIQW